MTRIAGWLERHWRLAVVAGVALAALFSWFGWRSWQARQAPALARHLPEGGHSTLWIDFSLLRRSGVLGSLQQSSAPEEPDYQKFVAATGFDYRKDLDGVLATFRPDASFFIVTGRMSREKFSAYATANGGRCENSLCSVQGSAPDRQISWTFHDGVLMLAVSKDPRGAAIMLDERLPMTWTPPPSPVWISVEGEQAKASAAGIPGLVALLGALEGARRSVFFVGGDPRNLSVQLDATCPDESTAKRIAGRLTEQTTLLGRLLTREAQKIDPNELSGILTSGKFEARANRVTGSWPVPKPFLDTLTK